MDGRAALFSVKQRDRTGDVNSYPVVLVPAPYAENAFLSVIMKGLGSHNYRIELLRTLIKGGMPKNTPVVMNWFEEVKGKMPKILFTYFKKRAILALISMRRGGVVYVVHNRCPHDGVDQLESTLSMRLRRTLAQRSRAIVMLCGDTREVLRSQLGDRAFERCKDKMTVIHHPSYEGVYPQSHVDMRKNLGLQDDAFLFLFCGMVRRYKNIELIQRLANEFEQLGLPVSFLVAGRCPDEEYRKELMRHAGANMHYWLEFIPDEKMQPLVDSSDCLILPYNTSSSLNSGTCVLAFTLGKTVVCPTIGTLHEFPEEWTYGYEYREGDAEDHYAALRNAAFEAYHDWSSNSESFYEKGRLLMKKVNTEDSWEEIGDKYTSLFKRIASDGNALV